jgi:hypothetical protein
MIDAFPFIEVAIGGSYRRNRIICVDELPAAIALAGSHEFGPAMDCFSTYTRHGEDFPRWLARHRNANGRPTVSGYDGPAVADVLPFDFDSAAAPKLALADVRVLVLQVLRHDHGVDPLIVGIWFSGAKGFSVEIPAAAFGLRAFGPFPTTSALAAKQHGAADALAQGLATADWSLYSRGRLWRVPNTLHSKTGLYKIPLTAKELERLTIDEIRELARKPRIIATHTTRRSPTLASLWKSAVPIEHGAPRSRTVRCQSTTATETSSNGAARSAAGLYLIGDVVRHGVQHNTLRAFMLHCLGIGTNPWVVLAALRRLNAERLEYPAPDAHLVKLLKGCLQFIKQQEESYEEA